MKLPIYQVDAFANDLFSGNPAAVIICETELAEETMQKVASENNVSETAFVMPKEEGYQIRWFTPLVEVDLCGHATLASAHVLFVHRGVSSGKVTFNSRSGLLHVKQEEDLLFLDFPADRAKTAEPPEEMIFGLGRNPAGVFRGRDDYMAVFETEEEISSITPDAAKLVQVCSRGVIVTAPGRDYDFVSRFFAPQTGVLEDPVTGSAHTVMIPYWSGRLGKAELRARQISGRGGDLICRNQGERVEIGGRAVTYLQGEISL